MSPSHDQNPKTNNNKSISLPPHLKINKDSHSIKKSSSSSPPSSTLGIMTGPVKPPQQQRTPVIIYTHSPKIIHTDPRDFMALVQKLTGMSRPDDPDHQVKRDPADDENNKNGKICGNDENESSSVITTDHENCGDGQVNSSCFVAPIFEPPNPFMANIPVFTPNSADFLCANFQHYSDSFYFNNPNLRTSLSSSSSSPMEAINDFPDY